MAWRPIKISTGKPIDKLLTNEEKERWARHPATKNIYRFIEEEAPKNQTIAPPFEAKDYVKKGGNPKKPKIEHGD